MAYFKPQSPLKKGSDHIYPLTTYDQIIMEDGSRWNGKADGDLSVDTTGATQGEPNLVNADQLGGYAASEYLRAKTYKNELTVTLSKIEWSESEDGYVQLVAANGVTANNSVIVSSVIDNINSYYKCGVRCVAQEDGYLTFVANRVPMNDLPVNVLVIN